MPRPAGSGAQPLLAALTAEAVLVGQGKSVRTARRVTLTDHHRRSYREPIVPTSLALLVRIRSEPYSSSVTGTVIALTIFGPEWDAVSLSDVRLFLDGAVDEPLLWEAKGTKLDRNEVRRQVAAFANSHEGGYLILGADRPRGETSWTLNGVQFPDEPMTWITSVIADPEAGVRPRPDFDVISWGAAQGDVAVVRVWPTPTPPCLTNGTVYERLPGKTQTVRDPQRLAALFAQGDEARRDARARADRAAETVLSGLEGDAGTFRPRGVVLSPASGEELPLDAPDDYVRFAVGVATVGVASNISGRLFRTEFAEDVWTELRDRPSGLPPGFGYGPDAVEWSQEALTWRHQTSGFVEAITLVRATWDGAAAVGQKLATEDVYPDSIADARIRPEWHLAERLARRLGGFGDLFTTVIISGGHFPRRRDQRPIVMRRGPLPGSHDRWVASFSREFMRAVGNVEPEP